MASKGMLATLSCLPDEHPVAITSRCHSNERDGKVEVRIIVVILLIFQVCFGYVQFKQHG